ARQVVNERLQLAKKNLPEGVDPEIGPVSTGLGEIYQYTLESDHKTPMELRTIQDWLIAPQLRTIPGVTEVNSFGGFVKQYHIEVSPEKLIKFGLTLRDVFEAVQQNNANAGGNYIVKGWEQSYVCSIGLIGEIPDMENIVIKAEDGTPVFLRDVAEVKLGPETRYGLVTRDGKGEAVAGMVIMLKGSNSKEVVDRVKAKIPQIQKALEKEGVKINAFYDRTSLIQACVTTVSKALLEGGILVILILFIFLWNFRAGLITALSLPFTALITFVLMKWQGISANLMSLGGLAIAIGMIVDSSIVVTENIVRHLSEKESSEHGLVFIASRATKEVIKPILFAILIIIVVFFPIFTLEQTEGKMFKPLAITICLAMFASLFVGLVITPVLCSLFFRGTRESGDSFIIRIIKKLYQPVLLLAMRHRIMVICLAVISFLASLFLLSNLGTEFIPTLDEGSIAVNIVRLPSASLEGSKAVAQEIERRILKFPEVKTIVSKTGRAEISEDPMGPEQSDIFIMLHPQTQWRYGITKNDLIKEISQEFNRIPGIRPSFSQPIALRVNELISGVKSDLAIKIFGDDLEVLRGTGVE
ncbi:MAG: efflux RND transporter permease subunit, partial [Planctomycetota bacterium]|nr:efflux RND transporter permease subunit [Planctomycetota bacterium]